MTALRVMVAGYQGDHLAEAEDLAEDRGLDPVISFDETMPAGKAILGSFAWGSSATVEVKPS